MIRPGRLKRVFERVGITENIFVLFTDLGDWNKRIYKDGDISSIDYVRGGGGEPVGVQNATLTVNVKGVAPDYKGDFNSNLSIDAGADDKLSVLLSYPKAVFAPRFNGRLLRQTVTDPGPARLRTTELVFTDWITETLTVPDRVTFAPNYSTSISYWFQQLANPMIPQSVSQYGLSDLIYVERPAPERFFSAGDGMSNLVEAGGYVVVPHRNGYADIRTCSYMDTDAKGWKSHFPWGTLPRELCLTPAKIVKRATHPGRIHYDYRKSDLSKVGLTVQVGNHTRAVHTANYDTTPWIVTRADSNDQLYHSMVARANRLADLGYQIPEVHIDLLALLDWKGTESEKVTARGWLGDLLRLDLFDPIAVGGDWPTEARGVYLVTQITEHIDKDSWTMTLGLTKDKDVTGYQTIPVPPGGTWNTRLGSWDNQAGTWNNPL